LVVSLASLVIFVGATVQYLIVTNSNLLAEVLPRVLAEMANMDRAESKVGTLTINPLLEKAARLKADDMASKGYFAHTSPQGLTPRHWFSEVGYDFAYAGENLAVDFSDSGDVNEAWMNSPKHRFNIMNSEFTEIGIGVARGIFEGRETVFVVQMFGRPAEVKVLTLNEIPSDTGGGNEITAAENKEIESDLVSLVTEAESRGSGETFMAVSQKTPVTIKGAGVTADLTTPAEDLLVSPKRNLYSVYIILGSLVALALILMIFIEIRIQHPRNIAYGAGTLVLILTLFLMYQNLILSKVIIV